MIFDRGTSSIVNTINATSSSSSAINATSSSSSAINSTKRSRTPAKSNAAKKKARISEDFEFNGDNDSDDEAAGESDDEGLPIILHGQQDQYGWKRITGGMGIFSRQVGRQVEKPGAIGILKSARIGGVYIKDGNTSDYYYSLFPASRRKAPTDTKVRNVIYHSAVIIRC